MQFEETLNIGMLQNKLQSDKNSEVDNFIYKSTLENFCNSLATDCVKHIALQFDLELGADVSEETWLKQLATQLNSLARLIANKKLSDHNIEVRNA